MTPTIGRIVIYNTTVEQREQMGRAVPHCNIQDKLPAIIVAIWGSDTCVNLKVILDGPGELWVTSSLLGDMEGNWSWPQLFLPK